MMGYIKKLDDLGKTMNWLINGLGNHGLKISDVRIIDWDWICKHYNVDGYTCKHNKVVDIGYVVVCNDTSKYTSELFVKHWDGYCEICSKIVHGDTKLNNSPINRWS